MRALACTALVTLLAIAAFGQSTDSPPRFEVADVHISSPAKNPYMRGPFMGSTRYEIRTASMLDLVETAFGFDSEKVIGGPNWLETDRFDVIAKAPPGSSPDTMKLMLQTLLAERFNLVVHKDTKPMPGFSLTAGKKPQLKEGDGSGETGCRPQSSSGPPPEGGGRLMMSGPGGVVTTMNLGPGGLVQYTCRDISMSAFVETLPGLIGTSLGRSPVLDETGLKGTWTFDLKWTLSMNGPLGGNNAERITIFNAVDKQLGLKLDPKPIPLPVIVVDSVNRTPTANLPGVTQSLPPLPTEFEVAEIKPSSPEPGGPGVFRMPLQIQPGGRVNIHGMTLKNLILTAWDLNGDELLAGGPKFLDSDRFDIIAKAPTFGPAPESPSGPPTGRMAFQSIDRDAVNLMLRALLIDRFKLTFHNEDRPVSAFTLTALKPKLKPADPSNRMGFREGPGPDGKDPRIANPAAGRLVTCQNMTMAQFAEKLSQIAGGYIRNATVLDATGIEGAFDFSLNFSGAGMVGGPRRIGGGDSGGGISEASDPGGGITLSEAIEKQLGLKLETTKRPSAVMVIDHVEQKPTEN